jgi:hypothetical protein
MMPYGNARGTVLIEALVAGVVLAIAVIGLASQFSSGQSFVLAEGDQRDGISLAQQKIGTCSKVTWSLQSSARKSDAISIIRTRPKSKQLLTGGAKIGGFWGVDRLLKM